jgi:glycosyltransferase involved in cell wall biosynthesis
VRIAFVTDTFDGGIAGGVVSALRFVDGLRRRHEVTVVATGKPAPGKVVIPGFQVPLHSMRENRFTFGWPQRSLLEKVFADVDVVHLNFPFLLGFGALRIARRMGVPTVAAFHVQPENVLMNVGIRSPLLARWGYRRWVRGFFDLADAVVCPSDFAAERLRSFGLTVPAWVVSNGAPGHRTRASVRRMLRRPDPAVVLCVGRLAREKRQDVIIDAVARSRYRNQIRLVMAGAGPLEQPLRERAQRHGLAMELGYVSDTRLAELYAEAHLFVHASEVELEGIAVLEAMAAGLPVLVADAPDSAARRWAAGKDFLFQPGDPQDLAAHLDRLLDTPGTLAEGSRHSLTQVARHDLQRSTRSLERVYEAVVALHSRQPDRSRRSHTQQGAA